MEVQLERLPFERPVSEPVPDPLKVRAVDIDMPFNSMVKFMVKWAIAVIPAAFVVFLIYFFASLTIFAGLAAR